MFCNGGSPHLSLTNIVNLSAFIDLDKALNLKFLKIETGRIRVNGVVRDVYRVGPIIIHRHWEYRGLYSDPASPGYWVDTQLNCFGEDIISLKLHLASILSRPQSILPAGYSSELLQEAAVQFRPAASRESVVDDLIARLGIDIREPEIRQSAAFRGWSQVPWVSHSSPLFGGIVDEDGSGKWPDYCHDDVPFLGRPRKIFEMRDAMGRVQQIIGSWPTAWKKFLLLSFTLWQRDSDPPFQSWKFGRSAIRISPYGLRSALAAEDATVVIDDDLFTVDRENCEMMKHHASTPPIVFLAWPKGMSGTTPANTDWTHLRGRKLLVVVGNDRGSFVHALELNDELKGIGATAIEFILPKDSGDGKNEITVDHEGGEVRGVRMGEIEFLETAKERFNVFPKCRSTRRVSNIWNVGHDNYWTEADWIMKPWLERGTINLIYSEPGVGKSWFVRRVLYALATGERLWGRFDAPKKLCCLYLAGETSGKMCKRLQDIHAAMGSRDGDIAIDVYPNPGQNIGKLNLEYEDAWKKIEKLTEKADVIAIDHLTAFTSGHNTHDGWSRFHALLRQLTQQGKTILLLHHAGKNGLQRGTTTLDIDVDTKIHIKRLPKNGNGFCVEFEKHRDDETMGKALQPFLLYYERGSNGLLHWWTEDADSSELQTWVSQPEANIADVRCIDEDFISAKFEEKKADIIRCLAVARLKGKPGLRRPEIDSQINVSASTTRSFLKGFASEGTIVMEGQGKATTYALSEEIVQLIIHE